MLDASTRRRIDTARDILVGKVPDPKSQVEQITIALIYKFMDDMDAESEEWGGQRVFFAGDFARFGWAKLMAPGLGGYQTLDLYAEAITRMAENPGVPPLFRDIFSNAYLPYRDPETLRLFLKVIDEFSYDHSERLGDAFEYLLSVLGSQGDAGQFRTPRHIIDFIVEIIDPKKDESVLDPACGTAGFLISSYKRVLASNSDPDGNLSLTPDERARLVANFRGYDISPDMVRLSLANMYLHGFPQPAIHEYDTLTSEDRWDDYADVILANPPFMSPKGGIRPHNRFSIKSRRSEVLFVDYIAEHLTPNGRAGVIVPEGIIFQSQNAHKQLRKMLVEDYLVAVISLPAGVFQPYSGVKTSILIMDKALARNADSVAFFKVENDGYDLGAQRRPIAHNDLPAITRAAREYLDSVLSTKATKIHEETARYDAGSSEDGSEASPGTPLIVSKDKIADSGDYNLNGERYRVSESIHSNFEMIALGEICEIRKGTAITRKDVTEGEIPVIAGGRIPSTFHNKANRTGETITVSASGAYAGFVNYFDTPIFASDCSTIKSVHEYILTKFIFHVLKYRQSDIYALQVGMGQPHVYPRDLDKFEIPVPPLEIQHEIVAEIEAYQKIIDGAQAVITNYRPHIAVAPDWPMVKLGQKGIFSVVSGGTPKSGIEEYWNGGVPWITLVDLPPDDSITEITSTHRTISREGLRNSSAKMIPSDSVVVSSRATIGRIGINRIPISTNQGFKSVVIEDADQAIPEYVAVALTKLVPTMEAQASGSTYKEIIKSRFVELQIPLPPLNIQKEIIAEIKAEQSLVAANHQLIQRMETKIQSTLARLWQTPQQPS